MAFPQSASHSPNIDNDVVYLIYNQHAGRAPIQLSVHCNPSTLFSRAAAQGGVPSHQQPPPPQSNTPATRGPPGGLLLYPRAGRGSCSCMVRRRETSLKQGVSLAEGPVCRPKGLAFLPGRCAGPALVYEARLLLLTLSFQRSRSCLCQGGLYPPHQRTGLVCLGHENRHFPGWNGPRFCQASPQD